MNDNETTPVMEVLQTEMTNPLEAISRAEVDMQIATAKKYPRSLQKVRSNMMSFATLDEETAQACFYAVPRGGKTIQGPSVRLAEIAVSCYGNLRAGSRILSTVIDGPMPHVTVQGVCHDLENNVAFTVEKRRRITKKKNKDSVDEDDVNLAVNACAAIAFRDAVYKVVPMALIKPVYEQCIQVAIGDAQTLSTRRTRALEKLAKMGVTGPQVLTRLSRASVEDITVDDLAVLYGIHNAIKDHQTTVDDEFPAVQSAAQKPNLKTDAGATATPPQPPTQPEKPAEPKKPKKEKAAPTQEGVAAQPPTNVTQFPTQTATPAPAETQPPPQQQGAVPSTQEAAAQESDGAVAESGTALSKSHQECRDILFSNGVKVSRFLDFMEGSGRFENATTIGFEAMPEEPIRRLITDAAAFAKCVKYCKS